MPSKISEDQTRKEMNVLQLETAGWYLHDHAKVKTEIPADGYDAKVERQVNGLFYSQLAEALDA